MAWRNIFLTLSLVMATDAFGAEPDGVTPWRQDQPPNEPYSPQEAIRKMSVGISLVFYELGLPRVGYLRRATKSLRLAAVLAPTRFDESPFESRSLKFGQSDL
jgi:hypothetical protein